MKYHAHRPNRLRTVVDGIAFLVVFALIVLVLSLDGIG